VPGFFVVVIDDHKLVVCYDLCRYLLSFNLNFQQKISIGQEAEVGDEYARMNSFKKRESLLIFCPTFSPPKENSLNHKLHII